MKILLTYLLVCLCIVVNAQTASIVNTNRQSAPPNPASVLQRFWDARFVQDAAGNTPDNFEGVNRWLDQVGSVPLDLIYTNTGKIRHQANDYTTYSDTPDSRPTYFTLNGNGGVMINNTLPQRFETNPGVSYAGAVNFIYYLAVLGGTDNEKYSQVSNTLMFGDRDPGTVAPAGSLQSGQRNTQANFASGTGRLVDYPYIYRFIMVEIVSDAAGITTLYVNGQIWASGATVSIGTNTITEAAFGSNAHPANALWFSLGIYTGARDLSKVNTFLQYNQYYHGKIGRYLDFFPYAIFETGTTANDAATWNAGLGSAGAIVAPAYTFKPVRAGCTEGNTQMRLYTTGTTSIATAVENRTYVMTKTKNIDTDWDKFFRNTDYTASVNQIMFLEIQTHDTCGNSQLIATQTQPFAQP